MSWRLRPLPSDGVGRDGHDNSSRLFGLLYWLLLIWYAAIVCALAALAVSWPSRPITSAAQIAWWSPLLGLVVVIATRSRVSGFLDRSVHHLVFGQHDDAYDVVDRVHRQLHADPAADTLLPTLAATLAATLKLPYVAIDVNPRGGRGEREGHRAASFGSAPPAGELIAIPLRYQARSLGTLRVSARRRDDPLSVADLRLLDDLARHVGITLHAARLSEALQASRQQLVTTREEERRRVRRDLHDGLGPTLASIRLQLGVVQRSMRSDPAHAERVVAGLREDVREATADIRRLVYELRPPLLDEFGLVGALRALGPDDSLTRSVHAADQLPSLPAAVEVAVYRIAAEALHNSVRHAGATHSCIRLVADGDELTLTVTDDGSGLPADYLPGVGHHSMHERATELGGRVCIRTDDGGGTEVTAVFPLADRRG